MTLSFRRLPIATLPLVAALTGCGSDPDLCPSYVVTPIRQIGMGEDHCRADPERLPQGGAGLGQLIDNLANLVQRFRRVGLQLLPSPSVNRRPRSLRSNSLTRAASRNQPCIEIGVALDRPLARLAKPKLRSAATKWKSPRKGKAQKAERVHHLALGNGHLEDIKRR